MEPLTCPRASTWLVAAAILAIAGCREDTSHSAELQAAEAAPRTVATEAVVRYVIDGDTVELVDGTRVRILMVDAPEATRSTECFGEEATQFTRELLSGRPVRMTADVVQTDRYGRALRHLEVDGRDVSEALVGGGYACVLNIPPNGLTRLRGLLLVQEHARATGRGLWGNCASPPC